MSSTTSTASTTNTSKPTGSTNGSTDTSVASSATKSKSGGGGKWWYYVLGALALAAIIGLLVWLLSCGGSNSSSGGTATGTGTGTSTGTQSGTSTGTTETNEYCFSSPLNFRLTSNGAGNSVTANSATSQLWKLRTGAITGTWRIYNVASNLYMTAKDTTQAFLVTMTATPDSGSDFTIVASNRFQSVVTGLFLLAPLVDGGNVTQIAGSASSTSWTLNAFACASGTSTGT